MDVRLLMDGGVPLAAPPGKTVESPPPNEGEFKKILQETESETKEIGEVAETEPKPQLQDLDSEMTQKETPLSGESSSFLLSLALLQLPTQLVSPIDPNLAGLSEMRVALSSEIANSEKSVSINALQVPVNEQLKMELGENMMLDLNVKEITVTSEQTIQPTSAEQIIGQSVLSLETEQTSNQSVLNQNEIQPLTEQAILSDQVNLPISKSNPNQTNEVKVEASEELSPVKIESAAVNPGKEAQANLSGENSNSDSGDSRSPSDESVSDTEFNLKQPENVAAPEMKTNSSASEKVESFRPLDRADRAKVVSQLVERIETLAANSVRNEVKVRMEPAELGTVLVSLKREVEGITAQLVASDERVKEALKEGRNELSQALAVRGLGSVKIEVGKSESMNLQSNLGQNSSSPNPQEQQQKDQPKQSYAFGKAAIQQTEQRTTNRVSIRYGSSLQMEI